MLFRDAVCLVLDADHSRILFVSITFHGKEWQKVILHNQGRPTILEGTSLQKKYSGSVPIDSKKKNDLLSALNWMPPIYHEFYKAIKSRKTSKNEYEYLDASADEM